MRIREQATNESIPLGLGCDQRSQEGRWRRCSTQAPATAARASRRRLYGRETTPFSLGDARERRSCRRASAAGDGRELATSRGGGNGKASRQRRAGARRRGWPAARVLGALCGHCVAHASCTSGLRPALQEPSLGPLGGVMGFQSLLLGLSQVKFQPSSPEPAHRRVGREPATGSPPGLSIRNFGLPFRYDQEKASPPNLKRSASKKKLKEKRRQPLFQKKKILATSSSSSG